MEETYADIVLASIAQPSKRIEPPASFFPREGQFRRYLANFKADMIRAKKYVLDDDVTSAAVELGMQHPEILLAVLKNAFAPFDHLWIEWNPYAQIDAAHAITGTAPSFAKSDLKPARHTGVLVTRIGESRFKIAMVGQSIIDSATGETYSSSRSGVSPLGFEYDLHSPLYAGVPASGEQFICRHTGWEQDTLRAALVGSAYAVEITPESVIEEDETDVPSDVIMARMVSRRQTHIQQCDNLSAHARWTFDPVYGEPFRERIVEGGNRLDPRGQAHRCYEHAAKSIELQVQEESGVFRFVISVIALMIGRDRVAADVPIQRQKKARLISGKRVPFVEARRVSLTVPRKIANRRILRALAKSMPRALHDVEGHWKQKRKNYDFDCEHVMVWETPRREVCAIKGCGFKRWRVDDFKRGDPSMGVVEKTRILRLDRKVTPIPAIVED